MFAREGGIKDSQLEDTDYKIKWARLQFAS